MMDIRDELQNLPPPDPAGVDRVWQRYQDSRTQRTSPSRWIVPVLGLGVAVVAATFVLRGSLAPEGPRELALDGTRFTVEEQWSDVVRLDADGQGKVSGTDRNVEIKWESGTITAHVTPDSGTELAVVTDEARVEVVGTVFSVTRDRMGVTTSVAKGRVKVACASGWEGHITPDDASKTCLPVRPALLLARADALTDAGAAPEVILETLDRGVGSSEAGGLVHGELLVRRMRVRGELGDIDTSLADARLYLSGDGTRNVEVNRHAGWLAMGTRGCEVALPFLGELEQEGSDDDRVLLAECLASSEPTRARGLLEQSLAGELDATWSERARTDLLALEGH